MKADINIKNVLNDKDTLSKLSSKAVKDSYHNFHNFDRRLSNYLNYHIVEYENEVIAMAGMFQSKFWPSNFVRVLDRCYYFKKVRSNTLNSYQTGGIATTHLLPLHIKIALEKNLIPFFSIACIKRRAAMKKMIKRWNINHKHKLVLLPKMYFTCNQNVDENPNDIFCWQNVAILDVDGYKNFNLPYRELKRN